MIRWAIQWRSKTQRDGEARFFMWAGISPHLFRTRAKARRFIKSRYGYIKHRPDLRGEPHGWRMPQAVKVRVRLEEV
jgi:hypothetical protein